MADSKNPVENLKLAAEKIDPQKLVQERQSTHGDWMQQSALSQRFKSLIYENAAGLQPYQIEALDMIAVKMSRILCGDAHEVDHWRDISSYSYLGQGGRP